MITKKINLLNLIYLLLVIILIINLENYYYLSVFLIEFVSSTEKFLSNHSGFTWSFIELTTSLIFLLICLFVLIFFGKRIDLLQKRISLNGVMVIFLTVIFFFSPLLVNTNPNFQKDISVRRMKGPLSNSNYIKLGKSDKNYNTAEYLYGKLSRFVFDNEVHYFTQLSVNGDSVLISKGLQKSKFNLMEIESSDSQVVIYSNFHLFGTDHLGRDIYTQLIYAIRISLFVAVTATLIASIIGITVGALSGQFGGVVDIVISRISDVFLSIPPIFLILLIIALFGSSLVSVVLVLALTGWISLFRIVKAEYLNISKNDFVNSAKLLGFSKTRVFFVEIFPLMLSPIIVNIVFLIANVILAEAILSFLGLGLGIDHVSLGKMLQIGQEHIGSAWWLIAVPGIVLIVIILSFNNMAQKIQLTLNPLLKHD